MSVLLRVPVDSRTTLLVEAERADIVDEEELALAAPEPGRAIAKASHSLGMALEQLEPMLHAVKEKLVAAGPDHATVEFGVKLGGETGVILARGTVDVNLKITMTWDRAGGAG